MSARPLPPLELPNRRPGIVVDFLHGDAVRALTIGFDPASRRPAEVFLNGFKAGSEIEAMIDNDMIALSKLLQAGADPAELAATFGPATLLGAVAGEVAREGLRP